MISSSADSARPRAGRVWVATLATLAALACFVGCGDDGVDAGAADAGDAHDAAAPGPDAGHRPEGPIGTATALSGGAGVSLAAAPGFSLADAWVEQEYALAGTASAYAGETPADGRFALAADGEPAEYRTRIVVRRPADPGDFNGSVVVEWLNVSGGFDANPDFTFMADELQRSGYAWVGVSAQYVGIEGGPVLVSVAGAEDAGAGKGLRALDPARYASLSHPGDAYANDIYTQVARTLRSADAGGLLGELVPERILAVGESQSAFMLTTYANGVQPLQRQYDGFLVHSRGSGTAPLGMPGAGIDLISGISRPATRFRDDLNVPVLILQSETDMLFILNYFPARQPDTDGVRTWEMAGTAHADSFLLGSLANSLDCGGPINAGQQHFVVRAALHALDAWVRTGQAPPTATPLEIDASGTPAFVRDADGIVLGGIRTPAVEAPLDVLSGAPPAGGSVACSLFGSTTPLPDARIGELYADSDAYLQAYTRAADAVIAAGFVLDADRQALLDAAQPARVP